MGDSDGLGHVNKFWPYEEKMNYTVGVRELKFGTTVIVVFVQPNWFADDG
jgi:hypothetical protein